MMQARAINEKVGYPDYLDGDNVTQLEKDYAEVREKETTLRAIHQSPVALLLVQFHLVLYPKCFDCRSIKREK